MLKSVEKMRSVVVTKVAVFIVDMVMGGIKNHGRGWQYMTKEQQENERQQWISAAVKMIYRDILHVRED